MPFEIERGYYHPTPDAGSRCHCGRPAVAKCEGCADGFCNACWWKHSHTATTWRTHFGDLLPAAEAKELEVVTCG